MNNPFTHPVPKGFAPYWLREDDTAAQAEHIERLRALGLIHSLRPPAKHAPNPLARTWHD